MTTRISKPFIATLAAAVLFFAALLIYSAKLSQDQTIAVTPPGQKAFLNTTWGMTHEAAAKALNARLTAVVEESQFFTPYKGIKNKDRYKVFENKKSLFLSREATVTFIFFDDQLYRYYVFVQDTDGDRLDTDMRNYLKRAFGNNFSEISDGTSLRLIWHTKDRIVNYWLYQEDLSLITKYTARLGVVYRPIEDGISGRG